MVIWQVWDGDYDGDWVVASFATEELARDYAETYGLSRVESCGVLSALPHEAADPALRAERAERRAIENAAAKAAHEARLAHEHAQSLQRQRYTIADAGASPRLCSCRTFTADQYFVTANGYCGYCGGFTPEVYAAARGADALRAQIDTLALQQRQQMYVLCESLLSADAVDPQATDTGTPPTREA